MNDRHFDVDATPDMNEIDRDAAAVDRPNRIPSLTSVQWDTKKMIVAGAIGGSLLFAGLTIAAGVGGNNKLPEVKAKPPAPEVPYDPKTVIAPTLETAAQDPNAPIPLTGEQVPAIGPGTPGTYAKQSPEATAAQRRMAEAQALRDSARRSTLVAYSGTSGQSLGQQAAAFGGNLPDANAGEGGSQQNTALDNLKRTSAIGRTSARMIGDRNYLVTAGSIIPCTLQTAMDSSVPGYATCIVPRDIYSDNGRVVLMEKGTRVFGEYQAGLNRGQYRLFAMWSRAVTPRGVAIDITSPASDSLGRAGIGGKVDRFFWERFGSALLFSVLEDGASVASNAVGQAGSNVTRVPSDSASTILQDTQQIKPVLRVAQGTDLAITVAQDFDFAQVYGLSLK
ncbi:type IV secretion system protein VirB10 (plasmid) [Sphingobium sp. SJ10-10]|uniref:Inner membrane protein forms channel for type IV secretion of T-DNA complex (VirB10) n=1 Tax=Sphingomonas sp. NS2 TaxID=908605 RepID=A0A0D4ZZN6_9SPHN|nr:MULTISPECIES: type IV secretion system protein VirB10 [unclassified Sphingobium]AJW29413.1 Inner membrane protein forms channel for type IV secretion of T-DNA complex (VirB10) [Sphingomonas sp. NS2]AMK26613.1 VirB10 type IV secretion protein [Sphingobium sp. TKS]MEC6699632.1 type IV secretion system protein VirB10 [Sphingobium sp. SJ10-10]